jgi:hypothetical protein
MVSAEATQALPGGFHQHAGAPPPSEPSTLENKHRERGGIGLNSALKRVTK